MTVDITAVDATVDIVMIDVVLKNMIVILNDKFLFHNLLFIYHIILTNLLNYYSSMNIYLICKLHSHLHLL